MKKTTIYVIAIIAGLVVSSSAKAQDFDRKSLITFEQFKEKVSGVSVPGFSIRPQIENEEDEGVFQAAYVQGNDVFMIKIEARHYPPGWTASPYKLDGKNAEFGVMGNMGMLIVDLPETYSVLTLVSSKIKEKSILERIAHETGFMQIAPVSVAWPARIPADYRLKGVLMEASEGLDNTHGFSYQVSVTFAMSSQLIESLLELREKCEYKGLEETFYQFPDGIILDFPISISDEGLEEAHLLYEETRKIRFTYYFP